MRKPHTMNKLVQTVLPEEACGFANARRIASSAERFRAKNLLAYDVRELTALTDCFVMCSVTSEPQLKAVFGGVRDGMKEIGLTPLHVEGEYSSSWLLPDYGTILFHVFREKAFDSYDLAGLWVDAPILDLGVACD